VPPSLEGKQLQTALESRGVQGGLDLPPYTPLLNELNPKLKFQPNLFPEA